MKNKINHDNYENYLFLGLHCSILMNNTEICTYLINKLKSHFDQNYRAYKDILSNWINHQNDQGLSPLHYASYKGNIEIIDLLIENGANLAILNNKGLNVMHLAAQGDQPNSIVYFKEKYHLNIESTDNLGSTPLHWAIFSGSAGAFKFLISYDLDFDKGDSEGLTPLHLAIDQGKYL